MSNLILELDRFQANVLLAAIHVQKERLLKLPDRSADDCKVIDALVEVWRELNDRVADYDFDNSVTA